MTAALSFAAAGAYVWWVRVVNTFIKDAVKRPGALDASWYLSNVFTGLAIWCGGVGLKTNACCAVVE